jgi:AraC-like DNA-binding protein
MFGESMKPTGRGVSIHSTDADEARSIGKMMYYPHQVAVHGPAQNFAMHIDAAHLGPVTVGWLWYDTEVTITTDALESAYQVNMPIRGELLTSSGTFRDVATPTRAAVYRYDLPTTMTGWQDGYGRVLAVKIDRVALEDHLSTMLARPVCGPIDFDFAIDLADPRAGQWSSLLRDLAVQLRDPDALSLHPLMAQSLGASVMTGLILAGQHTYTPELHVEATPGRPPIIERAIDFIEAHLAEPLTVTAIAARVGLSVRSLQEGFQLTLNTTPMSYVRHARLLRIRNDLLVAGLGESVAQIAHRWGVSHLGRFACQYRQAFGESPSTALHARGAVRRRAPIGHGPTRALEIMVAS